LALRNASSAAQMLSTRDVVPGTRASAYCLCVKLHLTDKRTNRRNRHVSDKSVGGKKTHTQNVAFFS